MNYNPEEIVRQAIQISNETGGNIHDIHACLLTATEKALKFKMKEIANLGCQCFGCGFSRWWHWFLNK